MAKVAICLNTAWNLYNFRAGLIRALLDAGHEVIALAPRDRYATNVEELGCSYIELPMDNQGTHPGRDFMLLIRFLSIFRRERPDVYLGYTVKPNVYGSIAARLVGIPVINNVAGLGSVFIQQNWLTAFLKVLYRFSFSHSFRVFFQNQDDLDLFVQEGIVSPDAAVRIPGSGVDLERFACRTQRQKMPPDSFRFLFVGRLLWDKGIGEYVDAARIVKQRCQQTEFCVLGFLGAENPTAVSEKQVRDWEEEGVIRYLGFSDDVRDEVSVADCLVLPSYREGLSRTLLEAAAMGLPIVTSNVTGCRDVVEHGYNGFLCESKDARDLARCMFAMLDLPATERSEMGKNGRKKVEKEFCEQKVIQQYLYTIDNACSPKGENLSDSELNQ